MPAMRKNERRGPGMVISATGKGSRLSPEWTSLVSTKAVAGPAVCVTARTVKSVHSNSPITKVGSRRGNSMAGVLYSKRIAVLPSENPDDDLLTTQNRFLESET